jgi:tripartite-type tricarboxylate transporter receptor subunit TctC
LKDSPTIYEMMDKYKAPDGPRRLAKIILASGEFGRPLVVPPGVPADRLKILRDAFNKSVNDPALLAEAEKRRLEMDPGTGEELESLAKEVMSAPPDVVQRVQKMLGK